MTAAVFNKNRYTGADSLWQYDYGQILRIHGIDLPEAVEIHFSVQETGGESIPRIGTTKDGITDVPIPDSLLENGYTTRNYIIYAFVYLTDATSGQTEYKIRIPIKSRPKPSGKAPEEEVSENTMADILKAVNAIASGKADNLKYENSVLKLLSGETEIARVTITGGGGADAREIELQNNGTYIQWRHVGDEEWTNLVTLVDITGEPGEKGDDGTTPHIGDNGNWYISETDTGVKASGSDGITPTIGVNGNWYIGDTDTGVKASGEDGAPGKDGKSAYQYATDGGYTGTEAEFIEKLAKEYAEPIEKITVTDTNVTIELQPNKLYGFPSAMENLAITLAAPTDETKLNEYHFEFRSGATATTLTIPNTVIVPDGFTIEANRIYEISIMEFLLTCQSWEVTA